MAALTAARNTPRMDTPNFVISGNVSDARVIFQGAMACFLTTDGELHEGIVSTNLVAIGRFKASVDNTADGESAEVETGIFKWANSAGDAVTQASVGSDVFIEDDQTVSATNGGATQSRAGVCVQLDSDGVWVQMGPGL